MLASSARGSRPILRRSEPASNRIPGTGRAASAGEEMESQPGPAGHHPDPSGPRSHHAGEHIAQGRDLGVFPGGQQLQPDPTQNEEHVDRDREVVAAHRWRRNQPNAAHRNRPIERPGWVPRTGSERTLSVGWAFESVVSDGWRRSCVSSQRPRAMKTDAQDSAPAGSSFAGSGPGRSDPRHATTTAAVPSRTTTTVAGHEYRPKPPTTNANAAARATTRSVGTRSAWK